jgi:hypothetical protein
VKKRKKKEEKWGVRGKESVSTLDTEYYTHAETTVYSLDYLISCEL